MVVGTIIGASIFVQPSEITGRIPSATGVAAVWILAGLLTLLGALVCAELASTFTQSGGVYVYLREAYSPLLGFLWGWAMLWVMHSGILAAIATVFARYAAVFIPVGDRGTRGIAAGVIVLLSAVNVFGVRQGTMVQTLFTAGKLLAIAIMVLAAFLLGTPAGGSSEVMLQAGPTDFLLAIAAGLFAFGGWHMVTYSSEETVEPERTIPRALVAGTLIVTLCYVLLNAAYLYVLPLEAVASSTRVAADAADAVLGTGGARAMSALVMFSTFGALSGIVLAGPRVYLAMARDGLLFRGLAAVHPRRQTPHRAIALQAVISVALVLTGTYRTLFTRVVYTEWIFFGLMALGLMRLRRRPDLARGYSIWGYPWVPLIFALCAFAIVVNQIVSEPAQSLTGLGLVLLGVPVYALWARSTRQDATS